MSGSRRERAAYALYGVYNTRQYHCVCVYMIDMYRGSRVRAATDSESFEIETSTHRVVHSTHTHCHASLAAICLPHRLLY